MATIGKKFYLTARHGQFQERQIPGETYTSFNKIDGHLLAINYKKIERGDYIIRLHILDESNFYIVSLFENSRSAHAFYQLVKNIDLNAPVSFRIKSVNDKDVFYALQNEVSVKWYYINGREKEVPTQINERLEYYRNMVKTEITPTLDHKFNPFPNHLIYQPFVKKGLRGGYFDAYESKGRVIGPIGSDEQKYYEENGRN